MNFTITVIGVCEGECEQEVHIYFQRVHDQIILVAFLIQTQENYYKCSDGVESEREDLEFYLMVVLHRVDRAYHAEQKAYDGKSQEYSLSTYGNQYLAQISGVQFCQKRCIQIIYNPMSHRVNRMLIHNNIQINIMNKYEQLKYAQFLEELLDTEKELNEFKLHFVDINLKQLFTTLSNGKGFIDIADIRNLLIDKTQRLYAIMRRFDRKREGIIREKEFVLGLIPEHMNYKHSQYVSKDHKKKFVAFLKLILEKEQLLNIARKELRHIHIYEAFETIDKQKLGYLGKDELKLFLADNEIIMNENEVKMVMKAMKQDIYVRITLEVFNEIINPTEQQYYERFIQMIKQLQMKEVVKGQNDERQFLDRDRKQKYNALRSQHKKERRKELEYLKSVRTEEKGEKIKKTSQNRQRELQEQYYIRRNSDAQELKLIQFTNENLRQLNKLQELQRLKQQQEQKHYYLNKKIIQSHDKLRQSNEKMWQSRKMLQYESRRLQQENLEIRRSKILILNQIENQKASRLLRQAEQLRAMRHQQILKERQIIENYIRTSDVTRQSVLTKGLSTPLIKAVKLRDQNKQSKQKINQQFERKKRKLELEEELQRTRIARQVKKTQLELEEKIRRQCQVLSKIKSRAGLHTDI